MSRCSEDDECVVPCGWPLTCELSPPLQEAAQREGMLYRLYNIDFDQAKAGREGWFLFPRCKLGPLPAASVPLMPLEPACRCLACRYPACDAATSGPMVAHHRQASIGLLLSTLAACACA